MDATVTVFKGHTHAAFTLLRSSPLAHLVGRFLSNNLIEDEYIKEHREFINGRWVKVWPKWVPKYKYFLYDEKSQKMRIPIAYCDALIEWIKSGGYIVTTKFINGYELRTSGIHMKPGTEDRPHQIELIAKCSEKTPGMKGLAMQTGRGKTYSAIKSMVNLGYCGIVIVKGLMNQWMDSIWEFTDCPRDDVYKIQEFNSLALLAQNPNFKPKIFVSSLRTIQLFATGGGDYNVLPWNYDEFLRTYGIGVKIIDEAHQSFHATTMMDLRSNVPYNLYCTATFSQSNKKAREIFNHIFPRSIQYGRAEYVRYLSIIWINFYGTVDERKCVKGHGYMHARYEKELMVSSKKFNDHVNENILPYLQMYYINRYKPGYRALIFCASIKFVEKLTERLRQEYPDKKVISYLGGDESTVLNGAEIVVSTTGKSGTGLDLKGLIFAMNTTSSMSDVLALQMVGRIRQKEDIELIYMDRCDLNIGAQVRHAEARKEILRDISSKFFEYNGLNDLSVQTGEVRTVPSI